MLHQLRTIFLIALLGASAFLSGCAGLGPKFTQPLSPEDGKAMIYVYRARGVMTAEKMPGIKLNGSEIVSSIPEISYFPLSVAPGNYEFTPSLFGIYATTPLNLEVAAGQTYFISFTVKIGHLEFQQANPDAAMAYMSTCYLLNPSYAKDPRVLTQAPAVSATAAPEQSQPVQPAAEPETAPQAEVAAPEPVATEAQLFVLTEPPEAKVRIMNIKPVFTQGMVLAPGRYNIDVSADDYKHHAEWITLARGEKRELQIILVPLQPQAVTTAVSAPAPASLPGQEPVSAVRVPAQLTADEKHYTDMLQSGSALNIRNAAKNIYYRYSGNSYLADVAEQTLLTHFNEQTRDNMHVDAMAWLCKALARTGSSKYRPTLQQVAESANNKKLRGYAAKALNSL